MKHEKQVALLKSLAIAGITVCIAAGCTQTQEITETTPPSQTPSASRDSSWFNPGVQLCVFNDSISQLPFTWGGWAVDDNRNWMSTSEFILEPGQSTCAFSDNSGMTDLIRFTLYTDSYLLESTASGYRFSLNEGLAKVFPADKEISLWKGEMVILGASEESYFYGRPSYPVTIHYH